MNMTARLILLFGTIFLISLGLMLGLNIMKFNTTLKDLTQSRSTVLLHEVANGVQLGFDLGLSLESPINIRNIQTWYSDAKVYDPKIDDIVLFGREGAIIKSANFTLKGRAIHPDWMERHNKNAEGVWTITDSNTLTIGIRVTSNIGIVSGGVVIVRSWEDLNQSVSTAFNELGLFALLAFGVMITFALPVCFFISRDLRNLLTNMLMQLSGKSGQRTKDFQAKSKSLMETFELKVREANNEISNLETKMKEKPHGDR